MIARDQRIPTAAEMRNMLKYIRKEFQRFGNCPLCDGVEFDVITHQKKRGEHASWCRYEELMRMTL